MNQRHFLSLDLKNPIHKTSYTKEQSDEKKTDDIVDDAEEIVILIRTK
jgi:hypothetical protein